MLSDLIYKKESRADNIFTVYRRQSERNSSSKHRKEDNLRRSTSLSDIIEMSRNSFHAR